jgi:hypothetical protein
MRSGHKVEKAGQRSTRLAQLLAWGKSAVSNSRDGGWRTWLAQVGIIDSPFGSPCGTAQPIC